MGVEFLQQASQCLQYTPYCFLNVEFLFRSESAATKRFLERFPSRWAFCIGLGQGLA